MNEIATIAEETVGQLAGKQPELGLVCITASDKVRFRTLTRKRFLQFNLEEQQRALRNLYAENLKRLNGAIEFCNLAQIRLYRLISGLFPFADTPIGEAILTEFADEMKLVGTQARELNIRLVLHPDQFVVLNSDRPEVIENSIKILTTHAQVFDMLGLPRSPWALMNIHGGKGDRSNQLIQMINNLPDSIKLRLTLENDEYTYSAADIFEICQAANIPMVFDAHHHVIHEKLDSYEDPSVAEMLSKARTTWQKPEWQLVHISNGKDSFLSPQHSDYITLMPGSYRNVSWNELPRRKRTGYQNQKRASCSSLCNWR
jgi:UV DNA damage endonuclease